MSLKDVRVVPIGLVPPGIPLADGAPYEMDADDNSTFEQWMERVDTLVWMFAGVSVHDLPDQTYRDWYDERLRPIRAADRAIRKAW